MSKRCDLTGRTIQTGNNVSHSNRKTRRTFSPNLQQVTLQSKVLGTVKLTVAVHTLRSIEHNGGLDAYLLSTASAKLTELGQKLKRKIRKAQGDTKPVKQTKATKPAEAA